MQIKNFILDLLFPPFCIRCGIIGTLLCSHCFKKVKPYKKPVELNLEELYLDEVLSATIYEEPMKTLIQQMKYCSVRNLVKISARIINYFLEIPKVDFISAIPMHPKKVEERGFNQAQEIAVELSKLTNIPYQQLLVRKKYLSPQANVESREERLDRMKNVFDINSLQPIKRNSTVLLVDDVLTTGTTINECARILKINGVKKVVAVTLAHGD